MLVHDPKHYMREALREADLAAAKGEVPVGAVIVVDNQIVARAHNQVEANCDASAHAEILAIRMAGEKTENWRLTNAALFVTLEPCTMCIGAMILARLGELYFGAYDERQGAVGSLYDLSRQDELPHNLRVFPEVLAEDCRLKLQKFFAERR